MEAAFGPDHRVVDNEHPRVAMTCALPAFFFLLESGTSASMRRARVAPRRSLSIGRGTSIWRRPLIQQGV